MDKLNQFVLDLYRSQPSTVTGSNSPWAEPTALEKQAYSRVFDGLGQDNDFLSKFEGTPLAPHAVALAERELAAEQRRLQRRMQRMAEDTWEQESIEQDQIQLQKQQLLLQLYKMKATTPTPQPGDAAIGQPDPAQMQQGAPEADPQAPKTAMDTREGVNFLRQSSALLGAGVGALGGGVAGAYKAGPDHRMSGALRGAAAGGVVGGLSGAAMGHGFARSGLVDAALIEDLAARQAAISDVAAKGARDPVTRNLILGGLAAAPVGGLAAGYLAGGTAKELPKQAELAKLSFTNPLAAGVALGAGVGAIGGGLAGARRGGPGHRMSGALRGAAAGGAVGAAGGAAMGHGMNLVGMADIMKMKDPVMQTMAARAAGAGMTGGQKALVYGGLGAAGVGGLAAGHAAGGTAKQSAMAARRREQLGSEIGGGDIGSFPVHEPTPKLSALPHINDVLHTPRATRGSVPSEDHLLEMGGNPYLPHHARKAILDAYLQERAAGSTASADEVMQDHLEAGRAGNQAGGALAGGFLVGPLLGAGLGGLAAHHLKHDIGLGASLGAIAGMPLGALAGGYLGGKRSVTPMTEAEAQRHIDKANLHREMYPQLMKDDAAKEHLLHQLSARHYENALDEARQQAEEDYYDRQRRYGRGKYSSEEAAIRSFAQHLQKTSSRGRKLAHLLGF